MVWLCWLFSVFNSNHVSVESAFLLSSSTNFPRFDVSTKKSLDFNEARGRLSSQIDVNGISTRLGKERNEIKEATSELKDGNQYALSREFDELSNMLGGLGRARTVWSCLRQGIDPLDDMPSASAFIGGENNQSGSLLGLEAKRIYLQYFGGRIENRISRVSEIVVSNDNTTKLLIQLQKDGLEVETVIIPWEDRKKSTLCISSQVGCRQGCTFCMTGRMGKLRNLSADEILSQVFHAMKETRAGFRKLYAIDNIVFMGMGEPADNANAVLRVANVLANRHQFQLAQRRLTISTVAPSPQAFRDLAKAPAALAWSVHSSKDALRRELVPTTRNTMKELREGLVHALQHRPRRLQSIMMEVALLDGINDSLEDANHLADFCAPIIQQVPNAKVVINIIPWNEISASSGPAMAYRKPSYEKVLAFQRKLVDRGMRCYIRKTRGDDSEAACGQLATHKHPTKRRP